MPDGRKITTEIPAERQHVADLETAANGAPAGAPDIDVLTKYQLLAAVARTDVGLAQGVLHGARDRLQHAVNFVNRIFGETPRLQLSGRRANYVN